MPKLEDILQPSFDCRADCQPPHAPQPDFNALQGRLSVVLDAIDTEDDGLDRDDKSSLSDLSGWISEEHLSKTTTARVVDGEAGTWRASVSCNHCFSCITNLSLRTRIINDAIARRTAERRNAEGATAKSPPASASPEILTDATSQRAPKKSGPLKLVSKVAARLNTLSRTLRGERIVPVFDRAHAHHAV